MPRYRRPSAPANPLIGETIRETLRNCRAVIAFLSGSATALGVESGSAAARQMTAGRSRIIELVGEALDYEVNRIEALSVHERIVQELRQTKAQSERAFL